jgi:DNA-binding transcriptional regulator YiaG
MNDTIHYAYTGEAKKEPYHYTESGLDDVYLLSGYDVCDTDYGPGVSVRDADELHRAIGLFLVRNKKILSSKELRFLRKEMDLTQSELGRFLGASDQSVARWEKGINKIGTAADRLIRELFQDHAGDERISLRDLITSLEEHDDLLSEGRNLFERSAEGWRPLATAMA